VAHEAAAIAALKKREGKEGFLLCRREILGRRMDGGEDALWSEEQRSVHATRSATKKKK